MKICDFPVAKYMQGNIFPAKTNNSCEWQIPICNIGPQWKQKLLKIRFFKLIENPC